MSDLSIKRKAENLVRMYGSRDPYRIAKTAGIRVYDQDLGRLLGMYSVIQRKRCIFLNRSLNEYQKRIVCAHELGHDTLHRRLINQVGILQEFTLMDLSTQSEIEANQFAAHLLLDDEQILDMMHYGYSDEEIAHKMCVNLNLLLIKLRDLQKEMGLDFQLRKIPRSDFMKKVP